MYQPLVSCNQSLAHAGRCARTFTGWRRVTMQRRRERIWAWLSVLLLVLCWDASLRMDEKVPLPRARLAHAAQSESELGRIEIR